VRIPVYLSGFFVTCSRAMSEFESAYELIEVTRGA